MDKTFLKQNGCIFMNSKNSKISETHRLLLNFLNKINLKRSEKYVALSNISIYYHILYMEKYKKVIQI